jgi:DNA-binding NarL/FixJ family response regulator
MPTTKEHKRRRAEVAVAMAIYGRQLSPRDREVARAYAMGKPVPAIAHMHGLSLRAVYIVVNQLRNML